MSYCKKVVHKIPWGYVTRGFDYFLCWEKNFYFLCWEKNFTHLLCSKAWSDVTCDECLKQKPVDPRMKPKKLRKPEPFIEKDGTFFAEVFFDDGAYYVNFQHKILLHGDLIDFSKWLTCANAWIEQEEKK